MINHLKRILTYLSEKSPEFRIRNEFRYGDLQLEGYDWATLSQEQFTRNYVALYWHSPNTLPTQLSPSAGIYQWGNRIVQVFDARNLIANGDFEWISLSDKWSLPYPWLLATLDPNRTPSVEVVSDEISISKAVTVQADDMLASNTYLQLKNEWERTFLSTLLHGLRPGSTYLLVGRFYAPQGTNFQIMQTVNNINQFPIDIDCTADQAATACGGVFSYQDEGSVYLHLGLYDPRSASAHYDDLGLFEINLPQLQK